MPSKPPQPPSKARPRKPGSNVVDLATRRLAAMGTAPWPPPEGSTLGAVLEELAPQARKDIGKRVSARAKPRKEVHYEQVVACGMPEFADAPAASLVLAVAVGSRWRVRVAIFRDEDSPSTFVTTGFDGYFRHGTVEVEVAEICEGGCCAHVVMPNGELRTYETGMLKPCVSYRTRGR